MYEKNVVALYRLAGMNGNIVSIQIITDFIWEKDLFNIK